MVTPRMQSFPLMTPERQLVGVISREDVMRALRETTLNNGKSDCYPNKQPKFHEKSDRSRLPWRGRCVRVDSIQWSSRRHG
jgi:predicted transcriptional regulator